MRRRGTAFLILLAIGATSVAYAADSRTPVMILGTFHFDQPGLDLINVGAGDVLDARRQAEIKAVVEGIAHKSIAEMLAFHNGPWVEAGNTLYLRMAELGSDGAPTGADVIADWYSRNLHIYTNIARLARDPGDRILVIYGSGHRDHLTDFFGESPDFTLVSPLEYLQERP